MSKSIFAKVAAVACSVASLSVLGITASAQKNTEIADRKDIVDGKTNIVAGIVEAKPGEKVQFPVYIANNASGGYSATGVRLIHDEKLTVSLDEDDKPVAKPGIAGNDITLVFSYNADKHIIGLGSMGTNREKDNGVMYEVEVTVPSDAKPGQEFPMTIEVDRWLDAKTQPVEHVAVPGKIVIEGGSVETTTSSNVTTTTTTTTSSTAPTTSSTAPTTSSSAPTTSSTAPTTSSTAPTTSSTVSTSSTASTSKSGTPVNSGTTAKGGSTSSTTATKTGDAGVGVAVAGLLLAAGTAVVATKKKKD